MPYLLILPAVVAEVVFVLVPIPRGLWSSVASDSGFSLLAYRQLLADPAIAETMLRTPVEPLGRARQQPVPLGDHRDADRLRAPSYRSSRNTPPK